MNRPDALQKQIDSLTSEIRAIAENRSFKMDSPVQVTAKFAELFAALSQLADISTRRIVRLTWWVCGLTIGLLLIAIVQTVILVVELKSKAP